MRSAVAQTSAFLFFAQGDFAAFQRERDKLGLEGTAATFLGQHDRLTKAERVGPRPNTDSRCNPGLPRILY